MKAYTTEEINNKVDASTREGDRFSAFDPSRLKQWLIDNGHRVEKPLNRWYKGVSAIVFFTGENSGFGLNGFGVWDSSDILINLKHNSWQPCPESEWKDMLIKQAKSRGYKVGNFKCLIDGLAWEYDSGNGYYFTDNRLVIEGAAVFHLKTGEWAEIIDTNHDQIEKLEKKLNNIQKQLETLKQK